MQRRVGDSDQRHTTMKRTYVEIQCDGCGCAEHFRPPRVDDYVRHKTQKSKLEHRRHAQWCVVESSAVRSAHGHPRRASKHEPSPALLKLSGDTAQAGRHQTQHGQEAKGAKAITTSSITRADTGCLNNKIACARPCWVQRLVRRRFMEHDTIL